MTVSLNAWEKITRPNFSYVLEFALCIFRGLSTQVKPVIHVTP